MSRRCSLPHTPAEVHRARTTNATVKWRSFILKRFAVQSFCKCCCVHQKLAFYYVWHVRKTTPLIPGYRNGNPSQSSQNRTEMFKFDRLYSYLPVSYSLYFIGPATSLEDPACCCILVTIAKTTPTIFSGHIIVIILLRAHNGSWPVSQSYTEVLHISRKMCNNQHVIGTVVRRRW